MRPRPITVQPVLNGFVVDIGCQRLAFQSAAQLGAAITEYYTDPAKTEKTYITNKVNDTLEGPQPGVECEGRRLPPPASREPYPVANESFGAEVPTNQAQSLRR